MSRGLALAALLWAACGVHAQTLCRLVAVPGVSFGPYDTFAAAPLDTLTNVLVTCGRNGGPQNVTLTMRLGQGANGSSVSARRMRKVAGTDTLAYGLYRDVSRSSVWGVSVGIDTVSQTLSVPNRGTRSAVFIIYGRIPALQDVSAGTYADSVDITLTP